MEREQEKKLSHSYRVVGAEYAQGSCESSTTTAPSTTCPDTNRAPSKSTDRLSKEREKLLSPRWGWGWLTSSKECG